MIQKKFVSDESGLTVTVETIIFFAISIILLLMIVQTFQGLNQKQIKIALEDQFLSIGNNIAKELSEMNLEAQSSLASGSITSIRNELFLPQNVAGQTYTVKLSGNKIILESSSDPYVTVEVPFNSDINIAENSRILSSDSKYVIQYDSKSCSMFFEYGGVVPNDNNAPSISIVSPLNGSTIGSTALIEVNAWDDKCLTKVEYQVDGNIKYTAKNPYNWNWDTTTMNNSWHNVIAIAYDAAGHTTPDTKSYYIFNGNTTPPNVTELSPVNLSNTTFKKPVIKAKITDNIGINFSSISLKIDEVDDRTANVTYSNMSVTLAYIQYIPDQDMSIGYHNISLKVKDTEGSPEVVTNWSFTISDMTDSVSPLASVDFDRTPGSFDPGDFIRVNYTASDINGSGLNNISIVVKPNIGNVSYYNASFSTFPNVDNYTSATWQFPDLKYQFGVNYTANITVFDRKGNKGFSTGSPLNVPPGQDTQLEVITGGKTLTSGNKILGNITLRDTSPGDGVIITITGINVSWNSSSEKISKVKIVGSTYWEGKGGYTPSSKQFSGNILTLNPSYTFSDGTAKVLELTFDDSMVGKSFTIIFYLSDGTTKTVTFST